MALICLHWVLCAVLSPHCLCAMPGTVVYIQWNLSPEDPQHLPSECRSHGVDRSFLRWVCHLWPCEWAQEYNLVLFFYSPRSLLWYNYEAGFPSTIDMLVRSHAIVFISLLILFFIVVLILRFSQPVRFNGPRSFSLLENLLKIAVIFSFLPVFNTELNVSDRVHAMVSTSAILYPILSWCW